MTKGNRLPLFIAIAAAALLGAVVYYMNERDQNARFDWQEGSWRKKSYNEENDQPYGALIFHRLLESYFPDKKCADIRKSIAAELPLGDSARSNYVFIGEGMYMDSLDTKRLLDYVAAGNTALIASKTIPFDLMFHIYWEECGEEGWDDYQAYPADDSVRLSLRAPLDSTGVFMHYARRNKPAGYTWNYMDARYFCDSLPQRPLGYINDSLVNFATFPHGQGRFLLNCTPIAFSNYQLLRPAGKRYAEGVLSHLEAGDIYWDAYSRAPEEVARLQNNRRMPQAETSPLVYVLQQPALAWAWYILVGMGLLYVLFRAKRRQRAIPILPKNENSSYEFISTIAHLHFKERDYRNMCVQGMKLFLAGIHERYGINASVDNHTGLAKTDAHFFTRLSQFTGIPDAQIRGIFIQYQNALDYEPTEQMMVDFHLATADFWRKAD